MEQQRPPTEKECRLWEFLTGIRCEVLSADCPTSVSVYCPACAPNIFGRAQSRQWEAGDWESDKVVWERALCDYGEKMGLLCPHWSRFVKLLHDRESVRAIRLLSSLS